MTRQPAEGLSAATRREGALGLWGVTAIAVECPVTYGPPVPPTGITQGVVSRRLIEPRTTPRHAAAGDREAVLPSPKSWPRVFPGL